MRPDKEQTAWVGNRAHAAFAAWDQRPSRRLCKLRTLAVEHEVYAFSYYGPRSQHVERRLKQDAGPSEAVWSYSKPKAKIWCLADAYNGRMFPSTESTPGVSVQSPTSDLIALQCDAVDVYRQRHSGAGLCGSCCQPGCSAERLPPVVDRFQSMAADPTLWAELTGTPTKAETRRAWIPKRSTDVHWRIG